MTRYKTEIVLPDFYDCKEEEKKILHFWHKEKIFQKVREKRSKEDVLLFYSGPVFPTGSPHSGHILNSILKDVFTRYDGRRKNLRVESRFGWDCHGIAVEHEVEKKLGIQSPADIEAMGIAKYNKECRNFVDKHAIEWRTMSERIGNWGEFDKEYQTMSTEYMEKVWGVFKQLFEKDLVYNATKVLSYSTSCFTHLSNFEAEQNYKDVTETGYTIVVPIIDSSEKLLIWTTNPSSLASNVALCVNPKSMYVKVKVLLRRGNEEIYILSKNSLPQIFPQQSDYTILDEFHGTALTGLNYEPLFKFNDPRNEFEVLAQEFVDDDIGSGIVPLDDVVLDALKRRGLIFKVEDVKYKKAFCWRSNTPLIHKRVNSWHLRVEAIADDLLKNSSEIKWCSADNGEDFRTWLKERRKDWSIGRTRYWGTPIPIWSSPSGDEIVCVGSIEELEKLSGKRNLTNIHREVVDWIVIPSKTEGNPPLRRVAEVFDCWFESGAVPFALRDDTTDKFTAEFVVEGRDQSLGWFYTTLVLSTALSQPLPFQNVVATGLVLNSDGSKVSKRRHNSNFPLRLIEKYGVDVVRLYLLSTPLTAGHDFEIQEAGVVNIVENVIQPLWRILKVCTSTMESKDWVNYGYMSYWEQCYLKQVMNGWILSRTESFIKFYFEEMDNYRVENVVSRLITLLREVEEWYIPCRKMVSQHSYTVVLFNIIYRVCLTLAPFAPFITEYIYQHYRDYVIWYCRVQSIHEAHMHLAIENTINPKLEVSIARMQRIVGLVRKLRIREIIPNHYKISEVILIHHSEAYQNDINLVRNHIKELVNAQNVRVSEHHQEFGAKLKAELKNDSGAQKNQKIVAAVNELTDEEIKTIIHEGSVEIMGQSVAVENIQISYQFAGKLENNCAVITDDDLLVAIKMNKELFYYGEGAIKDIVSRLKRLRRKGNYYPNDKAVVFYSTSDQCLTQLMTKHAEQISSLSNTDLKESACDTNVCGKDSRIEETADIKGNSIKIYLYVEPKAE